MIRQELTEFEKSKIYVDSLSQAFCKKHAKEILDIINIIPHIQWNEKDLFIEHDLYKNKWEYSFVVSNETGDIIGVLLAYFRLEDEKHIFDSIYIHKLAIKKEYQKHGIGSSLIRFFINYVFSGIKWLNNISLQTNDEDSNREVIRFYEKNGFWRMYRLHYPDKIDLLFLLTRKECHVEINQKIDLRLVHPRLRKEYSDGKPIFYFASTNKKKQKMFEFILGNYNIFIENVEPKIELIEPQVEGPGIEEERKLVKEPLKQISRFIGATSTPYVIEDTMLFIEYFNRNGKEWELPGLDTKRWLRQIGLDGMLEIMGNTTKRKAKLVSQTGVYAGPQKYFFGRGELLGEISTRVGVPLEDHYGIYPYFFHLIFVPDGATKTLAEMDMHEYAKYDYMRKGIKDVLSVLKTEGGDNQISMFDYFGTT